MKKSKTCQSLKFIVLFVIVYFFSMSALKAQSIKFGVGASYGIAPALSLQDDKSSASFYSFYGDLIVNKNFIGRAQFTTFIAESFTMDLEDQVDSGIEFNGSLGYNMSFPSMVKLEIPIMATMGYASIKNRSFTRPGLQLGVTIAPKYMLHEKIAANVTLRYLKGTGFEDGRSLSQWDTSFGVMVYLN